MIAVFSPRVPTACEGAAGTAFDGTDGPYGALYRQRTTCAACPVFDQCASFALRHAPDGLWAFTEEQRWSLGGVRPRGGSRRKLTPDRAIDQLLQARIALDRVYAIVRTAGLLTGPLCSLIAERMCAGLNSTPIGRTLSLEDLAKKARAERKACAPTVAPVPRVRLLHAPPSVRPGRRIIVVPKKDPDDVNARSVA